MELITILNRCHRFQGFVYQHAHFSADKKSIEVAVRPRKGSAAVCSRCHLPAPGYDQLVERRFEFIPLWGFLVFLLYTMRRVNCRRCGIVAVEEVPWGDGKRTLTKAYMLFLARWARRLSWKETAEAFRTSWDKVFDAVEHAVTFGLEHRVLGQIDAIGVDEIQYAVVTHSADSARGISWIEVIGYLSTFLHFGHCISTDPLLAGSIGFAGLLSSRTAMNGIGVLHFGLLQVGPKNLMTGTPFLFLNSPQIPFHS